MCGRYTLHQRADELAARYNLATLPPELHPNYNVAPGQLMPVITSDDGRTNDARIMKWGLVPHWARDPRIGYKLINARDDSVFDKPMWRGVILHQRCLVPADGFYEWKRLPDHTGKEQKHPFYIHPKQQSIFSFAGVWATWKDVEGQTLQTFSIITTEPNREMREVHNRMPVILDRADEAAWLDPSRRTRSDIEPLLRPYADGELELFEVSRDVNVARNNDEKLIYPLNSQ